MLFQSPSRFSSLPSPISESSIGSYPILFHFNPSKEDADAEMAPVKMSGPATEAEDDPSTPLEGPISLLWGYQLRREHALLLARIDSLAETARNEGAAVQIKSLTLDLKDAAAQIKSLSLDLKAAEGRITAVENDVDSHGLDLQAIGDKVSRGNEAYAEFQFQVFQSEKQHVRKIESVEVEQKNQITQNKYLKAVIATSEVKVKEQQEQIRQLQEKTKELEGQIVELGQREVTVVKDSMDYLPLPNFGKPQLVRNSNVSKKIDHSRPKAFSHANDLLQEIEEEYDSNLRIFHPFQREETVSTEFDLDAGVATLSYARHLRSRRTQEGSIAMLPELPLPETHQVPRADEHINLRQDHAQSWDQYLKEGRNLARRRESVLVRGFVVGIADPVLKADCEHWLDNRVWSWENIESFPAHSKTPEAIPEPISTAEPTPKLQRTGRPVVPRKSADLQAVGREVARLLEDQNNCRVESPAISRSPEPGGNRRSQRIAKKNVTIRAQATGNQQTVPAKPVNQRPVKTKEEPSKQPRKRCKQVANDPEPPTAEAGERVSVQPHLVEIKATGLKQADMSREISGISHIRRTVIPATRTAPNHTENRDLKLEDISDKRLREKLRKMHEVFPWENLRFCHEALVAAQGKHEDACQWLVDRTVHWRKIENMKNAVPPTTKLKSKKNAVSPSTPKRTNGYEDTRLKSPLDVTVHRLDPKTPEEQMQISRTSYKRKLELSEEEQIMNRQRARLAKKRKGPLPPLRILPSSDTE